MATCKDDCIHYDVCKKHYNEENSALPDLFDLWLKPEICSDFKNKADVVEVVRCKDCVCFSYYREPIKGYNGKCEITRLLIRDDNFFCRDGVRKMAQKKEGTHNG